MDNMINNPAVQGGLVPFLCALILAALLYRNTLLRPLAILAGFLSMVYLTVGFQFFPLTSTRKIVLLAITIPLVLLVLGNLRINERALMLLLFLLSAAAGLWLVWPWLARQDGQYFLLYLLALGAYPGIQALLGLSYDKHSRLNSLGNLSALAFACGFCVLLSASALLGQMALSVAASVVALAVVQITKAEREKAGLLLGTYVNLLLGLILLSALIYAKLDWYILPLILISAALIHLPIKSKRHAWQFVMVSFLFAAIPGGLALLIAYQSAGSLPY